jgi:hypothetical protein
MLALPGLKAPFGQAYGGVLGDSRCGYRVDTMVDAFGREGEWLRCALHAHTTRSDGELAPEALAAHYARAGYDVVAITDHWRRTDAAADGLLVIASAELNCILPSARDGHVLALGIDAEPAELGRDYADLECTADWIEEHGGIAYLAHPYWTGAVPGGFDLPANVYGLEVYNAGCELETGRGLSSVHWDELLEAERRCFAIATDDSHHPGSTPTSPGRGCGPRSAHARRCSGRCGGASFTRAPGRSFAGWNGTVTRSRCAAARAAR